jgi:hypothetical protein
VSAAGRRSAAADSVYRHADLLLAHLYDVWERLPEIEREIDRWDLIEQLVFIEEWPLEEMRLKKLDGYAAEGTLTPEQLARYHDLRRLVERHRPIMRRLQAS